MSILSLSDYLLFACLMLVAQFSPGPDMLLLTRLTLREGVRAGCWAAVGIGTGLLLHVSVVSLTGPYVLQQGTWWQIPVKVLATCYLLFLARGCFISWRRGSNHAEETLAQTREDAPSEAGRGRELMRVKTAFSYGLMTNLLNAKALLFFASVLTPFLKKDASFHVRFMFPALAVVQSVVVWWGYVKLLSMGKRWMSSRGLNLLDLVFGMLLVLLAGLIWI